MNKEIEYNYKEFRDNIFSKILVNDYIKTIVIPQFKHTYRSNKTELDAKFTDTYMNNLVYRCEDKIEKYIDNPNCETKHIEKYVNDMWQIYVIAVWPMHKVISMERNSYGNFSWKTDWDEETATHYNQNAYVGEY